MEILVFQQQGSGEQKIEGVQQHGSPIRITEIVSIDDVLPDFIEDRKSVV